MGLWCSSHFTGSPKAEDHGGHFTHVAVNLGEPFVTVFCGWTSLEKGHLPLNPSTGSLGCLSGEICILNKSFDQNCLVYLLLHLLGFTLIFFNRNTWVVFVCFLGFFSPLFFSFSSSQ